MALPNSTPATLDPATIARFRRNDAWLDFDRFEASLPELIGCDGCDDGIVQRVMDDFADDTGPSYVPVNGSSVEYVELMLHAQPITVARWLCPACAAANAIAARMAEAA